MSTGATKHPQLWLLVLAVLSISCVADDPLGEQPPPGPEPTSRSVAAEPTSTTAPNTSSTTAAGQDIPSGPYYLPSELPSGWQLVSLLFFSEPLGQFSEGSLDSAALVVHRSDDGFGSGGATLTLNRFKSEPVVPSQSLGIGNSESIEIPGLVDAEIEYDEVAGFGSVVAIIDEQTSMVLLGDVSSDDLISIAGALRLTGPDLSDVDIDLPGWIAESGGQQGEVYILGVSGLEGTLEIQVTPGVTQARLHSFSGDFERDLVGENGTGYFAIQRIEDQNLEFPNIRWWVPAAELSTGAGFDQDLIVEILDSFIEVNETEFRNAVRNIAVQIIEVEPTDAVEPGEPRAEGQPLDPEVLARLVAFVETRVGRQFDQTPVVLVADGKALRDSVPEGSFVSSNLWDLFLALGLVDSGGDRIGADNARRDRLRGVCCPVTVIDSGDSLFNEVVIVHELTHGLDADLGASGSGSTEPIDPRIALLEGNAHRVAFDYADLLNAGGADIPPPPNLFPADGDPRLPSAIQRILEFPYSEGRLFAVDLEMSGGEDAITAAFAKPPASTEQVMSVDAYLRGDDPAVVPPPSVPGGAKIRQQGTIGAFVLSLVAEPTQGRQRAIDLALNWSGDTYVLYDLDDQTCLVADIMFDDVDSADQVADVFTAAGATVDTRARAVEVAMCS